MYEDFYRMKHTPFSRNVPPEDLYESAAMADCVGRLSYVADRQLFAVVTADAGCGKSTLIRRFSASLPKEKYIQSHLNYAGVTDRELFSRRAVDEIFRMSCGIPRLINRICEKSLMYGCQQNLQVIDDQDVLYVSDHEMISGGDKL